ncbi:NosR/NirI family protein [Rhodobacteraceae bacterium DSL-40]|uniref:4Fe-4S binding protein n=1 Tax=Amaricoccus sp. B4 TaxID=3368557 RepID=UPI000DAEB1BA
MQPIARLATLLILLLLGAGAGGAREGFIAPDAITPAAPDAALAAEMFGAAEPLTVTRIEAAPPGWEVATPGGILGYIASTWEISGSVGYSGRPIDILVAITPDARIAGARLMRHNEPVLTLGISTEDIAAYVNGFAGLDLAAERVAAFETRPDLPDIIAHATVSTGVIRDAILRTARTLALGRGLIKTTAGTLDRVSFRPEGWEALVAEGALAHVTVPMAEARAALGGASVPLPETGIFLDLWTALLDPPTIGRNLLGQQAYTRAVASLGPGDALLLVASAGLHSHRGTSWRRSGVFDRIEVIQGRETITLSRDDFLRIDRLATPGAPDFREISAFRLPGGRFDPSRPFRVEVSATRTSAAGDTLTLRIPLDYRVPAGFLLPDPPEPEPLWMSAWQAKRFEIAGVATMLATLTGILFFQESFVRRPKLWLRGRYAFLAVTLVWLGWIAGGQLSVVQVVAFLQSLLTGFHWETFLIEPVIFLIWSFVGLGLLFWGRGVFCGWLCPFGALQELSNAAARRLGVPQIAVPFVLHERLWVIKYTLFVAILALSFYSMEQALILAEAEPFKTVISLGFRRAWPFLLFAGAILTAGLFIERFYCRYLCPLGAALAIPAKIKLFDWLRRRPQCGRECRLCEVKCTVGAIDPIGRINPNECILCMRCQSIYHDPATCTILKARANRAARQPAPPAQQGRPA